MAYFIGRNFRDFSKFWPVAKPAKLYTFKVIRKISATNQLKMARKEEIYAQFFFHAKVIPVKLVFARGIRDTLLG